MAKVKNIGLIGCGNFGEFILPYLIRHAPLYALVNVYDKKTKPGIWYSADIKYAASSDLVVLSVPSMSLESILIEIKDYVRKDAIVVDVCSVKMKPCKLMEKYLPETAEIIGTHPLFGPQSAKDGIRGLKMVLCPIRTNRINEISSFLETSFGLDVIVTSPEDHDRQMAYVRGLTHLIGMALGKMNLPLTGLTTETYEHLMSIINVVGHDSPELFYSIQKENPYSKEISDKFLKTISKLSKR